jgi:cell division protein FtsX
MKLLKILTEKILETYFVQVIIKVDNKNVNNTEVYNQIRALPGVVIVRVINDERIENLSTGDYDFQLLELKFLNKNTPSETINDIKRQALTIFGLVKFYPREKTLNKIKNY